jgi:hypothetical protein
MADPAPIMPGPAGVERAACRSRYLPGKEKTPMRRDRGGDARRVVRAAAFAILAIAFATELRAAKWPPVAAELLGRRAPVVEKDADAEAVFWDVRIQDDVGMLDGVPCTTYTNHVRIKIYTEKGRNERATVEIPFTSPDSVTKISGRTIRPDGKEIELDPSTVHEKTLVRAGDSKRKAKTFTLPSVEPGAVIEYRWTQERPGQLMLNIPIEVQHDLPVEVATVAFKPLEIPGYRLTAKAFGFAFPTFTDAKGGFRAASIPNVPALREEPYSLPDGLSRRWILVSYTDVAKETVDEYWKEIGRKTHSEAKGYIGPSRALRKVAESVADPEGSADERLRKLFEHCRSKVRNLHNPSVTLSTKEREKLQKEEDMEDVLAQGAGTPRQINLLFAALAASAGFEVRMARVGDRRDVLFSPAMANVYFLSGLDVAVKVDGQWRLFDPGTEEVPYGSLLWQEEGQKSLVCDGKEPFFLDVPPMLPERNLERRKADLKLSADGALEGSVRIELRGHRAVSRRIELGRTRADEREKDLREELSKRIPGAELTALEIEALADPEVPLVLKFRVRVPAYATRAGKRIVLPPAFFQRGVPQRLTASERRTPVWFPTGWLEEDEVRIGLPEGFVAEDLSWTAPFLLGTGNLYKASVAMEGRTLAYRRSLSFAGGLFETKLYPPLRQAFGQVSSSDGREVVLVPAAAPGDKG